MLPVQADGSDGAEADGASVLETLNAEALHELASARAAATAATAESADLRRRNETLQAEVRPSVRHTVSSCSSSSA